MALTSGRGAELATRLVERRPLVAAGVFDALSAVLAERAGFEAVFLSGSALALTQLGRPDVGLLTLTELADVVGRVTSRVDVPVLVDADYGFGNAINVYRTVQVLERAGASGIQLEDRVEAAMPADLKQRPVVSTGVMVDKIRAALDARGSDNMVISARTDALYSSSLDETLGRAECYLDAGADMIFVEGCVTDAARREVTGRLSGTTPVLFNTGIMDQGHMPSFEELDTLGYRVILFPGAAVVAAASAMQRVLADLRGWMHGDSFAPPPADLGAAIGASDFLNRFA